MNRIILSYLLCLCSINLSAQNQYEILSKAYKDNSKSQLKDFFKNWNSEINPLPNKDFTDLNDTVKNCYTIFNVFYNPLKIKVRDTANNKVKMYGEAEYFVVQNELDIYFTDIILNPDTVYTKEETDSIIKERLRVNYKDSVKADSVFSEYKKNNIRIIREMYGPLPKKKFLIWHKKQFYRKLTDFRPQTLFKHNQIIYLTEKYDSIIKSFLGADHIPLGTSGIMTPAQAKGESKKRKKFLEIYIKLRHGHWGGWHLITFPQIRSIVFDEKMEFALVQFRVNYEGGTAVFKKQNSSWEKLSIEMTWIE